MSNTQRHDIVMTICIFRYEIIYAVTQVQTVSIFPLGASMHRAGKYELTSKHGKFKNQKPIEFDPPRAREIRVNILLAAVVPSLVC